uniref:Uncharacterized protein n=1 Tax=Globodera rostochiensis TaxID=31243 RepID=A0A914H9U1_GLORO
MDELLTTSLLTSLLCEFPDHRASEFQSRTNNWSGPLPTTPSLNRTRKRDRPTPCQCMCKSSHPWLNSQKC